MRLLLILMVVLLCGCSPMRGVVTGKWHVGPTERRSLGHDGSQRMEYTPERWWLSVGEGSWKNVDRWEYEAAVLGEPYRLEEVRK